MKIDLKMILSMLAGAGLVWIIQFAQQTETPIGLITPAHAYASSAGTATSTVEKGSLNNCEMFFSDDRDFFETEINKRIKRTKLIQSNVIWSETTKNLGFYAMICY